MHYYWYEHMLSWNWSLDRDIWGFKAMWASPEYYEGMLMESWEWKDPQTMIGKIRQGVHWQNKPPANGREFTAYDAEFHYDRVFGTGSGFTEPNPILSMWGGAIKKVTAIDKYTVEIKFHGSSNNFVIWQPYLKGYSGENIGWNPDVFWPGLWVDQDLKNKMR